MRSPWRRAALALALAFGTAMCGGDSPPPGPGEATVEPLGQPRPARPEPAGSLEFLLPGEVAGLTIDRTDVASGPNLDPGVVRLVLGKPEPGTEASWLDPVAVLLAPASGDREVAPDERARLDEVELGMASARVGDDETATVVDWYAGGKAIVVLGPSGSRTLVVAVARAVRPGAPPEAVLSSLPKGYVVLARHEAPTGPSPGWSVLLTGPDGAFASVTGALVGKGRPPVVDAVPARRLEAVSVRGAAGVLAERPIGQGGGSPGGGGGVSVSWLERPDLVVTVLTNGDRQRALDLAASLRDAEPGEFRSYARSAPDPGEAPPTSG